MFLLFIIHPPYYFSSPLLLWHHNVGERNHYDAYSIGSLWLSAPSFTTTIKKPVQRKSSYELIIFVELWIYIPQIQPDDIDILCASAKPDSFLTSESSLMSGSIALRLLARDLLTYSMRLAGISLSQWHPASFVVLTAGKDLLRILTGFRSGHLRTHKCGHVHQHPVLG